MTRTVKYHRISNKRTDPPRLWPAEQADQPLELEPSQVLVVEDDEDLRELIALTLGDQGYRVVTAPNGKEARWRLERCDKTGPFAALIIDMWMPQMSGLELLVEMSERGWEVPVIVVSGFINPTQRDEAMRLGASHILPKPFALSELLEAVGRVAPLVWQ